MITLVDYGSGNGASILKMLRHIGIECRSSADPGEIATAAKLLLPGVGHFDACYNALLRLGLLPALQEAALHRRVPLLGVCVGAQLLGSGSEEGEAPGLQWLDMTVRRFPKSPGYRVPRMGWGEVRSEHQLLAAADGQYPRFYFAHSYYMDVADQSLVGGTTDHGIVYAAAVQRDNIVGFQFHPEKSHRYGMAALAAFAGWQP